MNLKASIRRNLSKIKEEIFHSFLVFSAYHFVKYFVTEWKYINIYDQKDEKKGTNENGIFKTLGDKNCKE